ncbi:MAG: phosphoribosyltransferase [Luteolibacter sp.]
MNIPPMHEFENRKDAGRHLAVSLSPHVEDDEDLIILGLPRGGVPVAAEVARILHKPFDVLIVRNIGVPGHEEMAIGAIASDGVQALNEDIISKLQMTRWDVDAVIQYESFELARREKLYRNGRGYPQVAGRTVVLVDDGIATGSTISAAIKLLHQQKAARIIVAVPVAPQATVMRLCREADRVVVVLQPDFLLSVSQWYDDFTPTTDDEIHELLADYCPMSHTPNN